LSDLPAAADGEKMKAKVRNSVLTVTMPKDARAGRQPRRIAVEEV